MDWIYVLAVLLVLTGLVCLRTRVRRQARRQVRRAGLSPRSKILIRRSGDIPESKTCEECGKPYAFCTDRRKSRKHSV